MMRELNPAGTRLGLNVTSKDRSATKPKKVKGRVKRKQAKQKKK